MAAAGGELPAAFIRVPESVENIFVAETSAAQFHHFARGENGFVRRASFHMSIGLEGSGKQHSGDKRTPLGVYFITERLDTSRLHEKYGVAAFPLDYPNEWDNQAQRNGDGIWVHGVDPVGGRRPKKDTDGCIALMNDDLVVLADEFKDNVSPLVVMKKHEWRGDGNIAALRSELQGRISEWVQSKASGDSFAFLSLYDDRFRRWGMGKAEWTAVNLQAARERTVLEVSFSELLLLAYPEEDGLYFSRFRYAAEVDDGEIVSTIRLYWRRDAQGVLRIVAENVG